MVSASPNLWDMTTEAKQNKLKGVQSLRPQYNLYGDNGGYAAMANPARDQGFAAQQQALGMYGQIAAGKGPSAAQAMLQQQSDQNLRMAMAMQGRARGGNIAQTGAVAGAGLAGAQRELSQQAAILRAQEQMQGLQGQAALGAAGSFSDERVKRKVAFSDPFDSYDPYSLKDPFGPRDQSRRAPALREDQIRSNDIALSRAGLRSDVTLDGRHGRALPGQRSVNPFDEVREPGLREPFPSTPYSDPFAESTTSDEKKKRPKKGMSATATIDATPSATYEYKPGQGLPPGQRAGVMAQDLERTPAGRSIVQNTPRGKMVDAGGAATLALAAQHEALQREKARDQEIAELRRMVQGGNTPRSLPPQRGDTLVQRTPAPPLRGDVLEPNGRGGGRELPRQMSSAEEQMGATTDYMREAIEDARERASLPPGGRTSRELDSMVESDVLMNPRKYRSVMRRPNVEDVEADPYRYEPARPGRPGRAQSDTPQPMRRIPAQMLRMEKAENARRLFEEVRREMAIQEARRRALLAPQVEGPMS